MNTMSNATAIRAFSFVAAVILTCAALTPFFVAAARIIA